MFVRVGPAHVTGTALRLRSTQARRRFKKGTGQNNHFLITVLVGLDGVRAGTVELSPEFSTSWSPHDVQSSYHRSRRYALESALVWVLDHVDGYRRELLRTPGLLSRNRAEAINREDGGAAKLRELSKELGQPDATSELMVRAAYNWRNRVVHGSSSVGDLNPEVRRNLESRAGEIAMIHRGLDVDRYLRSIAGVQAPTFKEVASTISAAQVLVEELDGAALGKMSIEDYAESLVRDELRRQSEARGASVYNSFWPGAPKKSASRLRQVLLQRGFSEGQEGGALLSADWIDDVSMLTARQARQHYEQD